MHALQNAAFCMVIFLYMFFNVFSAQSAIEQVRCVPTVTRTLTIHSST